MTDYNIHLEVGWKIFTLGVLFLAERGTWIIKNLKLELSDWIEHQLKKKNRIIEGYTRR